MRKGTFVIEVQFGPYRRIQSASFPTEVQEVVARTGQGRIAGRKLGGKIWRVHPDDLQAFIEASAVGRPEHEG